MSAIFSTLMLVLVGTQGSDRPLYPPPPPAATAPNIGGAISPPSTCEAPQLAYLVGHMKSEIPVPVYPSRRRVMCDVCEMTQEYRPDRTTILFDANTGVITAVTCG